MAMGDHAIWIGMAVPETDCLGRDLMKNNAFLLVIAGAMVLGLAGVLLIVRKYSHQLKDVPRKAISSEILKPESWNSSRRVKAVLLNSNRP